jgi:hypothetical protein
MDFRGLTQEVLELLSEAAVEIGNLDDRENVVCHRLRAFQNRLQQLQQLELTLNPLESTVDDLSAMLDVASEEVLEATAACGVGEFQLGGRVLSADELSLLIRCNEASAVTVRLTFDELWNLLDRVAPSRQAPMSSTRLAPAGQRKFAGSETHISGATTARQHRIG